MPTYLGYVPINPYLYQLYTLISAMHPYVPYVNVIPQLLLYLPMPKVYLNLGYPLHSNLSHNNFP